MWQKRDPVRLTAATVQCSLRVDLIYCIVSFMLVVLMPKLSTNRHNGPTSQAGVGCVSSPWQIEFLSSLLARKPTRVCTVLSA